MQQELRRAGGVAGQEFQATFLEEVLGALGAHFASFFRLRF